MDRTDTDLAVVEPEVEENHIEPVLEAEDGANPGDAEGPFAHGRISVMRPAVTVKIRPSRSVWQNSGMAASCWKAAS